MLTLCITPSAKLGRVDYHIQPPEFPLLLDLVFRIYKWYDRRATRPRPHPSRRDFLLSETPPPHAEISSSPRRPHRRVRHADISSSPRRPTPHARVVEAYSCLAPTSTHISILPRRCPLAMPQHTSAATSISAPASRTVYSSLLGVVSPAMAPDSAPPLSSPSTFHLLSLPLRASSSSPRSGSHATHCLSVCTFGSVRSVNRILPFLFLWFPRR